MSDYYRPSYAVRLRRQTINTPYEDFLMHYGVKGQKWGVRNYQNEDGTFTQAGLERYRQMRGYSPRPIARSTAATAAQSRRQTSVSPTARVRRSSPAAKMTQKQRSDAVAKSVKSKYTPEQIKARRAKAKKIIGISLGVAAAAALGYAAYKGSTNMRDEMRKQILSEQSKGYESINTLHSKYWDAADRAKYSQMTKERAQMLANNTNRRDAIVAKIYQKTGHQLNIPQNRARVLQERRSSQELGRFIKDAESRGHTNKQIHDARANLRAAQKKLSDYKSTQHIGTSKQYEAMWTKKHAENVDRYKDILNELLKQRAGRVA